MTGSPTRALHGADRLTRTSCPLSPCLLTLFKKISTPSNRHRGVTFHPPWAFCVLTFPLLSFIQLSATWVSATEQICHTQPFSIVWVSVTEQACHTQPFFITWVSATEQASHTHPFFIAWVSVTEQVCHTHPFSITWVSAKEQASHTHKLLTL